MDLVCYIVLQIDKNCAKTNLVCLTFSQTVDPFAIPCFRENPCGFNKQKRQIPIDLCGAQAVRANFCQQNMFQHISAIASLMLPRTAKQMTASHRYNKAPGD